MESDVDLCEKYPGWGSARDGSQYFQLSLSAGNESAISVSHGFIKSTRLTDSGHIYGVTKQSTVGSGCFDKSNGHLLGLDVGPEISPEGDTRSKTRIIATICFHPFLEPNREQYNFGPNSFK